MNENVDLLKNPILEPLTNDQVIRELLIQFALGNYVGKPLPLSVQPDQEFSDNKLLWSAVLSEQVRSGTILQLDDFLVFEWFPRSPGLYYTSQAEISRENALQYTVKIPISSEISGMDDPAREERDRYVPNFMRVFDLVGKFQMLNGGIGSIRLKDKRIDDVGRVWFLTASSTATAHEGFPIALPDIYYQQIIDQVKRDGVCPCTLVGELRFVPDTLSTLYQDYLGVPQLYLLIHEIKPSNRALLAEERPRVSVAVMFQSSYRGEDGVFSSYVTFYPSQTGSLTRRLDWLENTYVKSMYQGVIITDFDEQNKRFEKAKFSLTKVFDQTVTVEEARVFANNSMRIFGDPTFVIQGLAQVHVERITNMTHQEKVINIGNGNAISAPIVIADRIENSFNALKDAPIEDDVRKQLEELLKAVAELNKGVPPEKASEAEAMARDAETLVKEASSSKPRRQWYEVSLEGLKQAAINIGELAVPVLGIVEKLLDQLVKLKPI